MKKLTAHAVVLSALLALTASLFLSSCANPRDGQPRRDRYFGGQGNQIPPTHHVPRSIVR